MKRHYTIAGMHCHSCELLIEQHVSKVPGVRDVDVHHNTGVAEVAFEENARPDDAAVERAIRQAGYRIGSNARRPWITSEPAEWIEAMFALCLVFVAFLATRIFGLTSLTATSVEGSGALVALIVGLTAGVSTCAALVGGLVLAVSARHAERHPSATPLQKFRPHLFFNVGRVIGFVLLGSIIGLIGGALQPSAIVLGALTLAVGLVMISLGMKLTGLFPRADALIALPSAIARRLGITQDHEYSHWRASLTGALTFFLPCGFTQAMQLAAVTSGSAVQGALIMGVFAVGTSPGLLGIAGISSVVRGSAARFFFKAAGIVVIALGAWNVSNGWNLTGILLSPASGQQEVQGPVAELRDGKQYLTMEQWAGGYNPNQFTLKKGVPFVWRIDSTDPYTCASSLVVPSLGIRKNLVTGENIVEFIPSKTGRIAFSCSMGMFRGSITVID